jgi:flagellum-specific ATP synthase
MNVELNQSEGWKNYLGNCSALISHLETFEHSGVITKVTGLVMESVGMHWPIGSPCIIPLRDGSSVEAEVVGFDGNRLLLMPQSSVEGIAPGAKVIKIETSAFPLSMNAQNQKTQFIQSGSRMLPVGKELLGRILDAAGRPLDGLGPTHAESRAPLSPQPLNPLSRAPITKVLDVGIRAINSMLTVGRGQRMGLFAGSGVGKSVLLGMMARYTNADVIVVGLIGERGREVKEFIEHILGTEGLARSVVVAAAADTPPLMRMQGASYATTIAEYFRDEGKHVLLIMDSLTRYAMAQREIALAIGEPPATKGYPPSVFAKLPVLVERAGNGKDGGGSITSFYTVLTEGDDQQDPVADSARSILDGHIVLSRELAESGHYPAIDIEQSISRAMHNITSNNHQKSARKLKQLNSKYSRNIDLINVGAYVSGSDSMLDEAIQKRHKIEIFLQQDINEKSELESSISQLDTLLN